MNNVMGFKYLKYHHLCKCVNLDQKRTENVFVLHLLCQIDNHHKFVSRIKLNFLECAQSLIFLAKMPLIAL